MKLFTPKKKDDDKKDSEQNKSEKIKKDENEVNDNALKSSKERFDFNTPKDISEQEKTTQTSLADSQSQLQKTQEFEASEADKRSQTISDKNEELSFANINDDEKIKKLIEILASSNTDTINPVINFEKNHITYPILAKIGESEENIDYLEKLSSSSSGIFDREIYERLIVCPHHLEDFLINTRMYCPSCASMDISRLELIEHKVCGYIAERDEYGIVSVSDLKTCPNCKRQIKDLTKEIRLPGKWNKCNSCNKKFDNAVIKLHCRRFDHDFALDEVESVTIPKFKIKKDAGKNIDILTLLTPLRNTLTSLGFMVEELANVKGKSGMSHHTDIFAHNEKNQTVVILVKSANEIVDDVDINSTLVNVVDIGPTWAIFIGIPTVSERAKAMAATQNMMIVTGRESDKIIFGVEKMLSEKISIAADSQLRKL